MFFSIWVLRGNVIIISSVMFFHLWGIILAQQGKKGICSWWPMFKYVRNGMEWECGTNCVTSKGFSKKSEKNFFHVKIKIPILAKWACFLLSFQYSFLREKSTKYRYIKVNIVTYNCHLKNQFFCNSKKMTTARNDYKWKFFKSVTMHQTPPRKKEKNTENFNAL